MNKLNKLRKKFTKHYVRVTNPKQLFDVLKFCVVDLELHVFQGINNRLHKVEQDLTNNTYEERQFPYESCFINSDKTYVVIEQNSAHIFPEMIVRQTHYPSLDVSVFVRDDLDKPILDLENINEEMTLRQLTQIAKDNRINIELAISPEREYTILRIHKTDGKFYQGVFNCIMQLNKA